MPLIGDHRQPALWGVGQGVSLSGHSTLSTVDPLVHHATILEMNVENYRRRVSGFCRPAAGSCSQKSAGLAIACAV